MREVNLSQQTYSLLEPLARSLPNLEQLKFNNWERSEAYLDGIDNLPLLQSFSRLHTLTLQDVEMDQIYNYFKTCGGSNIRTFRLVDIHYYCCKSVVNCYFTIIVTPADTEQLTSINLTVSVPTWSHFQ